MKANELQIGDWAACEGKKGKVKELREHKLSLKTENSVMIVYYNNVEPIPITPEILEKNGFIKHADYCWLISENNGRRLIEYRTDYLDGLLRISYAEEPFSKLMIKVKYVHELQHALRLCGIDKEIEI